MTKSSWVSYVSSQPFAIIKLFILRESALTQKLTGGESKGRIPDEEINWNTAYHESGHVLVAHYTKYADPVHKVTVRNVYQNFCET